METMTADQARRLARQYLDLSDAVLNYHIEHRAGMQPGEDARLTELDIALRDQSRALSGLAGRLSLADLGPALDSVGEAIGQMQIAIRNIDNAGKAIQLIAKAVALGGALAAMDPGAIAKAIKDLAAPAAAEA